MKNTIKPIEKILITGGSGMVGSAINRAYLKKVKKLNLNKLEIFTPSRKELDLTNYKLVERWFKKNRPNIVILAAAKVGGILANKNCPSAFILENLKIQTNLIEISNKYNVDKFVFLGSSCIYPKLAPQPIIEESLLTSSLEETNQFYAIAKISGIKLCEALTSQYGFKAICLMPTNLYGQGDNYNEITSHVLPSFIKRFLDAKKNNKPNVTCWGTGKPLREFLHVDDLAEACLYAIEKWDPLTLNAPKDNKGKVLNWLNVGSNAEISIKDLALMIANIVDYKGKIIWDKNKPDGTPRKKLNTSRMKKLGWESKIELEEGIKLTIKHYLLELKEKSLRS